MALSNIIKEQAEILFDQSVTNEQQEQTRYQLLNAVITGEQALQDYYKEKAIAKGLMMSPDQLRYPEPEMTLDNTEPDKLVERVEAANDISTWIDGLRPTLKRLSFQEPLVLCLLFGLDNKPPVSQPVIVLHTSVGEKRIPSVMKSAIKKLRKPIMQEEIMKYGWFPDPDSEAQLLFFGYIFCFWVHKWKKELESE